MCLVTGYICVSRSVGITSSHISQVHKLEAVMNALTHPFYTILTWHGRLSSYWRAARAAR